MARPTTPTAPEGGYRPDWYQFLQGQQVSIMQKQWMEGLFPELVRRYEAGFPSTPTPEAGETGWAAYLRQYPFEQKWGEKPYWQRGERPSRFQPMLKSLEY